MLLEMGGEMTSLATSCSMPTPCEYQLRGVFVVMVPDNVAVQKSF
jgi:hypothetical protein